MRWLIVFWIFIISATAYLDRVNISIAARSIANEFHLSNVQLGWVFSAFVLGYALFQAPAGRFADRVGPRLTLAAGVVWWGIFTALLTFLSPAAPVLLWLVIGIRFCLGVGEAVVYPASNCVVASWIPCAERGMANGFIFAGVGFGAGVTPPLIAFIMREHGWRAAFWVSAAAGLAVGAIWYLIARDTPAQHPWISAEERKLIASGVATQLSDSKRRPLSWTTILGNRDLWAITLSYFAYGYAAYIFFSWFFIYLSEVRGLNLKQSPYYTMLPFLAMAIASPLGGWISDRVMKSHGKRLGRCGIAVVGMALAAIFIGVGTLVASAQLASVILAGGAGALYLSQSSFWSVSADIGNESAGSVSGFMNMGGQLGGALTASLSPAIANHFGWSASFLVAAALCACGALLWTTVNPGSSAMQREQDGDIGQ
ncbi:MAG: MFS transporter [Acidobacteriaceae bacterium]|nr:MFS transporter [Acidobacteriaceae bacterium]